MTASDFLAVAEILAMASLLLSLSSLPCSCSRVCCSIARSVPWSRLYSSRIAIFRSNPDQGRILGGSRRLVIDFALAESDSAKSSEQNALRSLLQDISDSLDLPVEYLERLPQDLRRDLNDAAFDLSNGPVLNECGQEVGELFSSLARSWEKAETSNSSKISSKLPLLEDSVNDSVKSAIGRRLLAAGRRFQGMGQYRDGELLRIGKAMIEAGKILSMTPVSSIDQSPKAESRMFKFGDLQVELTPEKANLGAAIGSLFGILSWVLSQNIQNIPESSLEYANDNASLLAKSLRGALLLMCYSSTVLSAFTVVGLVLLGRQLSQSKDK